MSHNYYKFCSLRRCSIESKKSSVAKNQSPNCRYNSVVITSGILYHKRCPNSTNTLNLSFPQICFRCIKFYRLQDNFKRNVCFPVIKHDLCIQFRFTNTDYLLNTTGISSYRMHAITDNKLLSLLGELYLIIFHCHYPGQLVMIYISHPL